MGSLACLRIKLVVTVTVIVFGEISLEVKSHGRLMEPPNRSSLWRFPEFSKYNPKVNYNDNELFCGGFQVQQGENGGRCGVCGDPWNQPQPRDNEDGGTFGKGVIAANYTRGQIFKIAVELTRSHLGFFRLRLCARNSSSTPAIQACFNKNKLNFVNENNGKLRRTHKVLERTGFYNASMILPSNITCSHCVLQWHYKAGNTWGICKNGSTALGCGPQEVFRGCADVAIS